MTKQTFSFQCDAQMVRDIKEDAKRRRITGSELVRQAVFDQLRGEDIPADTVPDSNIHQPTVDGLIVHIRAHPFLQWMTTDGETAGDKVAQDVLRKVFP